jgi:cytochrome P450
VVALSTGGQDMSADVENGTESIAEATLRLVFDPVARANPYPVYDVMRAAEPVYQSEIGPWFVTSYDDCARLLRDPNLTRRFEDSWEQRAVIQNSVGRVWFEEQERWMLWLDPPDHTRLRGLVSKAFTPRYVSKLHDRVAEIVDQLVMTLTEAGEVDFIEAFAFQLPITIICDMLGIPAQDRDNFRAWTVAIGQTLEPLPPEDVQDAADEATVKLSGYLHDLVASRRNAPGDDLLGQLIHAEEEGQRLTEDEIVSTAGLLLGAGFETTTNLLGNGMLALLRHPEQWELLVKDPSLATSAVEELLRYDSPVQMATPRVANAAVEAAGRTIRPGDVVINVVAAGNRDPQHYSDPEVVDIGRPDPAPLSFGGGPHFCLGAALARMEGAVAFEVLATQLPNLQLVEEDPQWRRALNLRGLESLRVAAG